MVASAQSCGVTEHCWQHFFEFVLYITIMSSRIRPTLGTSKTVPWL
jgi:hypothetical protein